MALILHLKSTRQQWWLEHLQSLLPDIECRLWEDPGDLMDIEYAVVWRPPTGGLRRFKNLKCIISVGAGIDHVLADEELPKNVPIIRTTGQELTQRMREYVCLHVLRLHRRLMDVEQQQSDQSWIQTINPPAYERRVGVMGLGNLGADSARALSSIGFDVTGWARREHSISGIRTTFGDSGLPAFLDGCEILVCLLPLTGETHGILNHALFDQLKKGACLINVARGEHLVEQDLLDAMASGQIAQATLDVFHEEPLPPTHPFWRHPQVLVTPHVASMIDPVAGGKEIAQNLRKFINGEAVPDMVDLKQGY